MINSTTQLECFKDIIMMILRRRPTEPQKEKLQINTEKGSIKMLNVLQLLL